MRRIDPKIFPLPSLSSASQLGQCGLPLKKGLTTMKKRVISGLTVFALLIAGSVLSHPHFRKTVSANMKGLDLKLQYTTLPYNELRLKEVTPGFVFHCGRAKLTVEGETSSANNKIVAGGYLVRAQAKSLDEWTLYLIPEAAAGDPSKPDLSKGLALETNTLTKQSDNAHLDLNLTGGHGPTNGKLVLSVAFGTRKIEGVLSVPAA
jgi:hypothetical protein